MVVVINCSKMTSTDAFTRGQSLIETILSRNIGIIKAQRKFIKIALLSVLSLRGRVNFTQLGREGQYNEQTYRNQFDKPFDFMDFNVELVKEHCGDSVVIGFDPSFINKSGKATPGLGYFYSGCAGAYKKGLEIGGFAAIDTLRNTAFHLIAEQTPSARYDRIAKDKTLVDYYGELLKKHTEKLLEISNVLVVDAYFSKYKYVHTSVGLGFELISRLRDDANLKYLFRGKQNRVGRRRIYNGKVNVTHIDKRVFRYEGDTHGNKVYSAVVYSVSLKCQIKVAYMEIYDKSGKYKAHKMIFSTNTKRSGLDIIKKYKSRFQIEFIYRDAKQYAGLEHCQSRKEQRLHYHFNLSLTSISIGKLIQEQTASNPKNMVYSLYDIATELANRNIISRVFSMYAKFPNLQLSHPAARKLLNFGKRAA